MLPAPFRYTSLLHTALEGQQAVLLKFLHVEGTRHRRPALAPRAQPTRLPVKQESMRNIWESRQTQIERATADDWLDWMRHLSVELLRESPSPALRACAPVAQMHDPLARRLFDVGFMACWGELEPHSRSSLIASIETALTAQTTPVEVLQELLALAEYMERRDQQLPLNIRMLGDIATKCGAFSKALHYRELEYQALTAARSSPRLIEALVSLHRSVGQPEAALGVLTYAQQRQDFTVKLSWLEKLGRWRDALTAYERAQLADPRAGEFALGRLRCLSALSEWQQLSRVCESAWAHISSTQQLEAAPLLAAARWHCQQWVELDRVVQLLNVASFAGGFFRAVLAVHASDFDDATHWIQVARCTLRPDLGPLGNEAYSRVYEHLVKAQQLSELEELIEYKLCQDALALSGGCNASARQPAFSSDLLSRASETCDGIRSRWRMRLQVCARELRVWQPMVELRAMALMPHEQTETWIKFSSLCRKAGRLELTRMSLSKLLPAGKPLATLPVHQLASNSFDNLLAACTPELLYAYSKYLWASGEQTTAINLLSCLLTRDAHEPPYPPPHHGPVTRPNELNEEDEYGYEEDEQEDDVARHASHNAQSTTDLRDLEGNCWKPDDVQQALATPEVSCAKVPHSNDALDKGGAEILPGSVSSDQDTAVDQVNAHGLQQPTRLSHGEKRENHACIRGERGATLNSAIKVQGPMPPRAALSSSPPPRLEVLSGDTETLPSTAMDESSDKHAGAVSQSLNKITRAPRSGSPQATEQIEHEGSDLHRQGQHTNRIDGACGHHAHEQERAQAEPASADASKANRTAIASNAINEGPQHVFEGERVMSEKNHHPMDNRLCMRAYLKLGSWQLQLGQASTAGLDDDTISRVLYSYQHATRYAIDSYKAWHAWALMNFTALTKATSAASPGCVSSSASCSTSTTNRRKQPGSSAHALPTSCVSWNSVTTERVLGHVESALRGFFRSITLGSSDSLQVGPTGHA